MKSRRPWCLAALAAMLLAVPTAEATQWVPGEILVKFASGTPILAMDEIVSGVDGQVAQIFSGDHDLRLVRLAGPHNLDRALAVLRARPEVRFAERNYIRQLSRAPDDPAFGAQWGLQNLGQSGGLAGADVGASEAWNQATGDSSVVVASIDTGLNLAHPDLAANLWVNAGEIAGNGIDDDLNGFTDDVHGFDFVNNDPTPADDHGHGSHTAGVIGAVGDNSVGVAGVSWAVRLMAVKVCDSWGACPDSAIIAGLDYAARNGAVIANNSYGGDAHSPALADAVARANAAGVLFVASAGDDSADNDATPFHPASIPLPNVIAVAATDRRDALADFSDYGATQVDLGAPGVDIYSTTLGQSYDYMSGASIAAAHVAGVAALLVGWNSTLTPEQLKALLLETARPAAALGGVTVSGGVVNAAAALAAAPAPHPPAANEAPAAAPGGPYRGRVGRSVVFDGGAAADADGRVSFYGWDFGDGVTQVTTRPVVEHAYAAPGVFTVSLKVYDNYNIASAPVSTTARIRAK